MQAQKKPVTTLPWEVPCIIYPDYIPYNPCISLVTEP